MRAGLVVAIAIGLGLGAGVGGAWWEFKVIPSQFEPHNQMPRTSEDGRGPRVAIEGGTSHDFGFGQRGAHMSHVFVLRNEGDTTLKLTKGSTSCKCTMSDLTQEELPPGQTAEVKLEYHLITEGTSFRQTAEIHTNDPGQRVVVLSVHGTVVDRLKLEPRELVLSDVSSTQGATAEFLLLGYQAEQFQVTDFQLSDLQTADFFDVTFTPQPPPKKDEEPAPTCAVAGKLTIKPGLPLGSINQTIHITTDLADAPEIELNVTGSVVSDISVVGPGLDREGRKVLSLGTIDADKGLEVMIRVLVKGPHRRDVSLTIQQTDPPGVFTAMLGEPTLINDGAVYMYPLKLIVAPGTRPIARMGPEPEKLGQVLIETTHPTTKSVPLYVRFAVR
jgi:hypothetical protein